MPSKISRNTDKQKHGTMTTTPTRYSGTVKRFSGNFGWIKPSTTARAAMTQRGIAKEALLYVHFKNIRRDSSNERQFRTLNEGECVTFAFGAAHKGDGFMAVDVTADRQGSAPTQQNGRRVAGARHSVQAAATVAKAKGADEVMEAMLETIECLASGFDMVVERLAALSAQSYKQNM